MSKQKSPTAQLAIGIAVLLGIGFLIQTKCNDPNAPLIFTSEADAAAAGKSAFQFTDTPLTKYDHGEPLTSADNENLRKAIPYVKGIVAYRPNNLAT